MELRSGRRLRSSQQQQGSAAGADGEDRISALHDDLLLLILTRLRCIATAVRTSVLSRRWSGGLWTRLREIVFRGVTFPSLEAALGRIDSPAVSLLDIRVPHQRMPNHVPDSAGVQSLLRAAARLAPVEIVFVLYFSNSPSIEVDLSSFHRATSIVLCSRLLFLRVPAGVETLSLSGRAPDLAPLLSCCRRLRTLWISSVVHDSGHLRVRSASLQELVVDRTNQLTRRVNIVAPVLKQLTMSLISSGVRISVLAPMVEEVYWHCWYCNDYDIAFGLWRLRHVTLQTAERHGELPSLEICANTVRLFSCSIYCKPYTKLIKSCQIVLPELACFTCRSELLCTGDREAYDCQVFCFGATSQNKWTCFRRARDSSPWDDSNSWLYSEAYGHPG
jgi:hypothetical protein